MTRKNLIQAIYDNCDSWSCPEIHCDMPENEQNTGKCCRKCAEKLLKQYDRKIYNKAIDEFMNTALAMLKAEQDTRYGYLDGGDIREIAEQLMENKMRLIDEEKVINEIYDHSDVSVTHMGFQRRTIDAGYAAKIIRESTVTVEIGAYSEALDDLCQAFKSAWDSMTEAGMSTEYNWNDLLHLYADKLKVHRRTESHPAAVEIESQMADVMEATMRKFLRLE